jgi:hypothetical protein
MYEAYFQTHKVNNQAKEHGSRILPMCTSGPSLTTVYSWHHNREFPQ